MGPDTPPDRWAALLSAVLESPVRRSVKPAGLPATPGEALLVAARQASGRIPALAAMLGLQMPPPPGPRRQPARPTRPGSHPPAPTDRPAPTPPSRPSPPSPPTPGAVLIPAGLPDASAQAPPADASPAAGDDGAMTEEPGGTPDAAQPEPAAPPSPAPPAEPSPPDPQSATEERQPVSEGGSDRTEATAAAADAETTPLPEVATEPAPPGTNGDAVAQALETAPPSSEHDGP
jgi:hypothetical protein